MSEAMIVPPLTDATAKRTPTVYFIDDSATMREVIKIAFRRENFNVIACADAASALAQFEQNPPDVVITDVIMPDQDGYSVCTQVKQHAQFGHIPVVLMSGVVNKTVADKAVSVQADELIRKPFQPQELIGRVKSLLAPKTPAPAPSARPGVHSSHSAPSPLTSLFAPPPTLAQTLAPAGVPPAGNVPAEQRAPESAWPRALAEAFRPHPSAPAGCGLQPGQPAQLGLPAAGAQPPSQAPARPPISADTAKLRGEIARLELLVKKLQTELQIERQYNQALELQIHTLTHSE
jgi:twitching motility two-component system response regulator PilH